MEKSRQIKIISMIALVVAIAGMTLGFAAFSKVLTITSSAQVTPNEEDFNIVTYGLKDEDSAFEFFLNGSYEFAEEYFNDKFSFGFSPYEGKANGTPATITNDKNSTTISNINVIIDKPNLYQYAFVIKNEGKYDTYINLEEYEDYVMVKVKNGICTAEDDVNQAAVDEVCKNIELVFNGYTKDGWYYYIEGTEESPYYKLEVGDYIYIDLQIMLQQDTAILDEPYSVDFEDITINFSTTPSN